MPTGKTDNVYARTVGPPRAFEFDAQVADVFESMIERSVPGYHLFLDMISLLTEQFAIHHTNCYDLGCSLGASTLRIRQHLPETCHVIGIDNSTAMVERCRINVERDRSRASIEIREEDLRHTVIENASIVVMNFTLQFIPEKDRSLILKHISDGLVDGGVLILCEKVSFNDTEQQTLLQNLHLAFKRFKGYSDLEISRKRAALENVLIPNTITEHRERLGYTGFDQVEPIVQCLNFIALLARRNKNGP